MNPYRKVVVSSDILKLDDRSSRPFESPHRRTVLWLRELLDFGLRRSLGNEIAMTTFAGDEEAWRSARWVYYSSAHLPLTSASWAATYEECDQALLSESIRGVFDADLAVLFECPPYLARYLTEKGVPFVDFSIHPARFLNDYFMGVRSNVPEIHERIKAWSLEEDCYSYFVSLSKSRTRRVLTRKFEEGSGIFFGQIEVDSSLIQEGKILGTDAVENVLREWSSILPRVYYKAHPHHKNLDGLKKMVAELPRTEWIEVNAYDAMGCEDFSVYGALSSGTLFEAALFGRTVQYGSSVASPHHRVDHDYPRYVPVYNDYLKPHFWRHVLLNQDVDPEAKKNDPYAFSQDLKFSINMKWGR